jgi:hypothetical protein
VKMGEVGRASAWTLRVVSLPAPRGREEVGGTGKPTPLPGEGKAAERVGRLVDASEMAGHSRRRRGRSHHVCLDSLMHVTSSCDRGDADRVVAHGVGIDGCVNAFVSNEVDRRCVLAASGLARAGYALAQHRCWRRRSLSCISVRWGEHEGESKGIRNGNVVGRRQWRQWRLALRGGEGERSQLAVVGVAGVGARWERWRWWRGRRWNINSGECGECGQGGKRGNGRKTWQG